MAKGIVKPSPRSSRKINILLFSLLFLYFVLNLFFACRFYNQETLINCYSIEQFRDARDDYTNCLNLEAMNAPSWLPFDFKMPIVADFIARPLCGPFYYFIASTLKTAGYSGSLIFPLQVVNAIFNCITLVFVFLILLKLSRDRTASMLGVLLVAFSFCFWYWGSSIKSLPITTAFLFISFYLLLLSRWHFTILSGIFMALAIGFTYTALVFLPSVILIFLFQKSLASVKAAQGIVFLAVLILAVVFIQILFYRIYFKKEENLSSTIRNSLQSISLLKNFTGSPLDIKKLQEASAPEKSQMLRNQFEMLWRRFSKMSILPQAIKWAGISSPGEPQNFMVPMFIALFILKVILLSLIISSVFFIKGWKENFSLLLAFFFWVLIPLIIFFFESPDTDYVYMAALGLIFFIAAASSFSKALRTALIVWLGLLIFVNSWMASYLSNENNNQLLIESKNTAKKIKPGTQFAYFDPDFGRRGEDIYLAYYSRAKMRLIPPLLQGKFQLNSNELIMNHSEFENCPGLSETVKRSLTDFLKSSGYSEIEKFTVGKEDFTLYKRN